MMGPRGQQSSTVTLITEDFPPKDGGIARWAYHVARHLGEMGCPVTILVKGKAVRNIDDYADEPFTVIPMRGHDFGAYKFFYSLYYVLKQRPRVLIALTWDLASSAVLVNCFLSARIVVVAHGLDVTKPLGPIRSRLCRFTLARCRLVVAVSRFTRDRIRERFRIPEGHILVLPNGVDPGRFRRRDDLDDLRRRYGVAGKKVILTLARIIERKGHDRVIEAMPRVLRAAPNAVYLIAGSGSKTVEERLRERAEALGIADRVRFIGYVPEPELSRHYSLADIYVMPSREIAERGDTEGFGITFLEANACEVPVIGGRSGGVEDAIEDGVTGLLVDPLDVDGLAEAIIRLLTDPEEAARMGKRGRARVEREFSWREITRRLAIALGL